MPSVQWKCPHCTFWNRPDDPSCEHCGRRKAPAGVYVPVEADYAALRRAGRALEAIEAAQQVGDSNFRRLEESLRKSGWGEYATKVQVFRKLLEAFNQLGAEHAEVPV